MVFVRGAQTKLAYDDDDNDEDDDDDEGFEKIKIMPKPL